MITRCPKIQKTNCRFMTQLFTSANWFARPSLNLRLRSSGRRSTSSCWALLRLLSDRSFAAAVRSIFSLKPCFLAMISSCQSDYLLSNLLRGGPLLIPLTGCPISGDSGSCTDSLSTLLGEEWPPCQTPGSIGTVGLVSPAIRLASYGVVIDKPCCCCCSMYR